MEIWQKNLTFIGKTFFSYTHREGINNSAFARFFNFKSPQAVINWLEKGQKPSYNSFRRIAEVLKETYGVNISINDLMEKDVTPILSRFSANGHKKESLIDQKQIKMFLINSIDSTLVGLPVNHLKLVDEYVKILAESVQVSIEEPGN